MLIEFLKPEFKMTNERGSCAQLVHDGYKQVNIIMAKPCQEGKGHYHLQNKELFYIIAGLFDLILKNDGVEETYRLGTGDMFCIPATVFHEFRFVEETTYVVLYDKGVELPDGSMDTIKEQKV